MIGWRTIPLAAVAILTACGDALGPGTVQSSTADDSQVPAATRAAYRDDAARLALRYALVHDPQCSSVVAIPADLAAALYTALVEVFNATGFPARDSVVDIYDIHALDRPPVHSVMVGVDRSAAWVDAWRQGGRLTGNVAIDLLMEAWDLDVQRYLELLSLPYDIAVLESAAPLNTIALAAEFGAVAGVPMSSPEWLVGDGNDILAARDSAGWRLDYSVGYGDCPAGCTERVVWTFLVFDDGRVRYEGSRGDPPPTT